MDSRSLAPQALAPSAEDEVRSVGAASGLSYVAYPGVSEVGSPVGRSRRFPDRERVEDAAGVLQDFAGLPKAADGEVIGGDARCQCPLGRVLREQPSQGG